MGGPAARGALGSELPNLIVLEVGVAEISQGRSLGAERARERRRRACVSGGGGRAGFVRGHGLGPSLVAAAGSRRSSTFALVGRTGKGNVRRRRDGDVWGATSGGRVHMYGARGRPVRPPHRAARQERARQPRPRRRLIHPPARPADERLADRDPRPRLAVLAGTVRRVGGPDHEPMPAGRDRPIGQGPSSPRASNQTDRSTPMAIRPVSSTMRATRPSCQVARLHGRGTRPPGRSCDGRDAAGARGRGSWPTAPMIPTWPGGSTVSRPSLGSSHRVREKPPARRC